jgi:hypothetical protein
MQDPDPYQMNTDPKPWVNLHKDYSSPLYERLSIKVRNNRIHCLLYCLEQTQPIAETIQLGEGKQGYRLQHIFARISKRYLSF